nr:retrovirus-related Pol polyprotein from transposon TNT 1-94 [Tanacetum cinerariifolium]
MSSPIYPIIIPSILNTKDALSSINVLDYTSVLPDYFPATSGNISSHFLENFKNDEIPHVFSPFYNNPYMEVMQAYDATKEIPIPPPTPTTLSIIFPPSPVLLPLLIPKISLTMLIFSRAPLFLWAEAIATACFTQNRSIIHRRFNKTPYELINGRKPDISFLHVFGALCYPKNDCEDIGKLGAKGDIGFFIGYSADSCAYKIYNRRTKKIMETMNVSFDELLAIAFEQRSSKPGLQTGSESRPPMLNKENYIPWSSRLLWFTSNEGESIESYYHRFLKLMNDLKRNKHFPKKIANNLMFLNNLQPEWSRHVTIVHQTKDLHTADYTQLYDFLKYNQKEVMQNAIQNPRVQNVRNQNGIVGVQGNGNQNQIENGHYARNCTVRPKRRDAAYIQTQLLIAQKEEAGIQLQEEEYDLMAAAADLDEIEEFNANCILMANLQQASTSGTQTDSTPIYDTDGSDEVHENCNDNEIFNMFTQEDQYTKLLKPILESHQVPQNDNDVISKDTSVEQGIQLQAEEYDLMAAATDIDEIEEVNANCILMANLQHASQDIMIIVQNESVVDTSDLQTELERTKERFKNYTIKKETEYAKLWNDLYKKCDEENAHLKATYKNLFDSISVSRAQTKTIIASLQNELQSNIYKTAKLRTQLFKKVSDQKNNTQDTSKNTKFAKQPIVENLPKVGKTNALSKPVTSNSVSTQQEPKSVNNDKVIAPGMFRINPSKTSREEKQVPNTVSTSTRTKPITISQPPIFTRKDVNSNLNGLSSTGVDNTKTRRPQPRSNTKNDRVPSASKSSRSQNKEAEVEEHHRNLLLSKNNKHISSA